MQACQTHVALVVSNSNQVTAEVIPTKLPGIGEILITPLNVGICGTDLQIIRRMRSDSATILGHEGVAEVVAVGSGVTNFSVGQKIVFNPVNPNNQNDILGHSSQGLFQQRLLISQSAIERGLVVPFDTRIPLICGSLVEPLGTVIYGQSLVGQICRPNSIAIFGAGPIGLLHAIYARTQGCSNIFLVHNSKQRLEWAVKRNIIRADEAFLDSPEVNSLLLDRTEGHGVDAVYLCTTRSSALNVLIRTLKCLQNGGCIDLVGGFSDGDEIPELPNIDLNSIRRANFCGLPQTGVVTHHHTTEGKEVWLTGHRGTSESHLKAAMQLLYEQPIRFSTVISHVVSLQAAPLIFERLKTAKSRQIDGEECVKIVIDLTDEGSLVKKFEPSQLLSDQVYLPIHQECSTPLPHFYRAVELSSEGPVLMTHPFLNLEAQDAVVIRPIMVGICRSDIKEAFGNRPVRHDFGHEIVGTVEWANPSVPLSRGELVCFDPHVHISKTSGFGDLVIAKGHPSALRNAFPKVIQKIPLEKLVFCEPTACAHHCVSNLLRYLKLSRLDGLRVGIIGAGNAGILIGLLVKYLGGAITLFNRSVDRLKFLQECQIFSEDELSPLSVEIPELFDVVIPTTSFLYSPVLKFAMQAVRHNGLVLLFGGTQKGDLLPDTNLDIDFVRRNEKQVEVSWGNKSFRVGGTYGALADDFSKVMELFSNASTHFPVDHLIIKEVSLEELPETLQSLAETNSQGKIVVHFCSNKE